MVKNKKGQLGNLQGIIMTLIVVGLLLGAGYLVLSKFIAVYPVETHTVSNETITPTTGGNYTTYNYQDTDCFSNAKVVKVYNQTGAILEIESANYTFSSNGLLTNITYDALYTPRWNITYTYDQGIDGCEGVERTIDATDTIPEFLPIIIIVAVVGILLAIVFKVLPGAVGGKETAYV
jgi:hypothetical protein